MDSARAKENEEIQRYIEQMVQTIDADAIGDLYEEGEHLGQGAYGRVYEGTDADDGEQYAIKEIAMPDQKALGREIKVMLEANHPNLCKVHKVFQEVDGSGKPVKIYLVMDLVQPMSGLAQSDLFEWIITNGPLDTAECCKFLYQTASALSYLNDHRIIHRDLKPENILLGEEGFDRLRLVDYGLARIFSEQLGNETHAATANVGSDGYQAPETMKTGRGDAQYGKAVDMWSLGVVTYITCCGAPPFGLGPKAKLGDIKAGKFKPMTGPKWAKVAPEMMRLIEMMLDVNEDTRITAYSVMHDPWLRENAGLPPSSPEELAMAEQLRIAQAGMAKR